MDSSRRPRTNLDVVSTFFSLRFVDRDEWYASAPDEWKIQVDNETSRIGDLRAALAADPKYASVIERLEVLRKNFTQLIFASDSETAPPRAAYRPDITRNADEREQSPFVGPLASIMMFVKSVPFMAKNPRCQGVFPNQRIPVYELLEEKSNNPLMEKCADGVIRYFHLPANHMQWVEKAMSRYYGEDDSDFNTYVQYSAGRKKQAELLLHHEGWYGNLQGPPAGYHRYMKPRCFNVTSEPPDVAHPWETEERPGEAHRPSAGQKSVLRDRKKQDIALYMPYLHWEYSSKRDTMMGAIERAERNLIKSDMARTRPYTSIYEIYKLKRLRVQPRSRRLAALGKYLREVAVLMNIMDEYADELLLRKEIFPKSPIQLRRTLHQSYRWATGSLGEKDQVVYRETRGCRGPPRLLMVDQLWMWILEDNTIITSFPSRYGARNPDPSDVHQSLCQRLENVKLGEIESVYDLAIMILDQCCKVFFDRLRPLDERPEALDIFANSINHSNMKTTAFESFWRSSQISKLHPVGSGVTKFDINPEGVLLREAQSIGDELRIMASHLKTQSRVIEEFSILFSESTTNSNVLREMNPEIQTKTLRNLELQMISRQGDIEDLIEGAVSVYRGLLDLLDLKQKQALITDIPRQQHIAILQTHRADEQSQVLMLFTVVTIIFLPLSFCSSIFGMNAQELNGGTLTIRTEFIYMIPISVGMVLVILIIAFSRSIRDLILWPVRFIWIRLVRVEGLQRLLARF